MAAIRFRAYADAAPALDALADPGAAAGLRLQLGLRAGRGARALRPRRPLRRGRHLGRRRRAQTRSEDLRGRARGGRTAIPPRRCTSATRPRRTSRERARPGSRRSCSTATGGGDIASLDEVERHVRSAPGSGQPCAGRTMTVDVAAAPHRRPRRRPAPREPAAASWGPARTLGGLAIFLVILVFEAGSDQRLRLGPRLAGGEALPAGPAGVTLVGVAFGRREQQRLGRPRGARPAAPAAAVHRPDLRSPTWSTSPARSCSRR